MELVHETGAALVRTIAKVADINRIVSDIAKGAKRQAAGVAEINATIDDMDKTTQQNAAMVEQSAAATRSLSEESRKLGELVALFRLGPAAGQEPAARARAARAGAGSGVNEGAGARLPHSMGEDWERYLSRRTLDFRRRCAHKCDAALLWSLGEPDARPRSSPVFVCVDDFVRIHLLRPQLGR